MKSTISLIKGTEEYQQAVMISLMMREHFRIEGIPLFLNPYCSHTCSTSEGGVFEIHNQLPQSVGIVLQVVDQKLCLYLGDQSAQFYAHTFSLGEKRQIDILPKELDPDLFASGTPDKGSLLYYQDFFKLQGINLHSNAEALERFRNKYFVLIT
jgi:hypothetical protein